MMRSQLLRSMLCIVGMLFIYEYGSAQDNKLRLHGISIGVGMASSSSETADTGLGMNLDFSTVVNRHIFSFNFNSGVQLNSDGPDEDFYELNLTYGRKWLITDGLVFEGHLGFGYMAYDLDTGPVPFFFNLPETTLGFPIRLKLIYYPAKKLGVGINPNVNFNSIEITYTANLIFQYNFR